MSNYITALQAVLADSYILYLKTQNYHWNVEGPHFHSLHVLFEEQYRDLFEANDEIAERIRTLGEKVDGTYKAFAEKSSLKEGDMNLAADDMVADLFASNQAIVNTMKTALKAAEEAQDDVTVDLMVGRITAHEKAAWMLRSSLPADARKKVDAPASY